MSGELVQISSSEAIRLGARDLPTFGQIFFPRTFRQKSPQFHYHISQEMSNINNRLLALMIFRDGAKTTLARTYAAKRLAYCVSRTMLVVNISLPKAIHTTRWLKRQIMFNHFFRETFSLRMGSKTTDEWFEVINSQGEPVNIVAAGITSGLRGLNIEDYRPDFIFCDDISDRENTATEEARAKQNEAFFAQLVRSLAPRSEAPLSQLVVAQTPINSFDIISQAAKDPTFKHIRYSCFDNAGQSAWPERRTTDSLLAEKAGYINRNQLAMWLAEMECQIVSTEGTAFRIEWLREWHVLPEGGRYAIICDPASSEEKTADFFAIAVLLFWREKVYLVDYHLERGLMPDVACQRIFDFARDYNARDVVIETVAYQKILKWYLEKEIQARRIHLNVHSFDDKRRKDDRMVQALTSVAPFGNFYIRETHQEFKEVFELYGPGYGGKVDLLDAVAIGISWHLGKGGFGGADVEGEFKRLRDEEEALDDTPIFQGAP